MKKILTTVGGLELISLDKFINKISIRKTGESTYIQFNTLAAYDDSFPEGKVTSSYQRRIAPLVNNREELKISLISQLNSRNRFLGDLSDMYEDIAIDYVKDYGTPSYMVVIGNRMLLATDPADFKLFTSKEGKLAIACVNINGNVVNSVRRITEKEARDAVKIFKSRELSEEEIAKLNTELYKGELW